jgi:hypothetical protein
MWPGLNTVKSTTLRPHKSPTFLEALVFTGSVLLYHVSRRYVIRARCCGEFSPSPEDVVVYHINNDDLV